MWNRSAFVPSGEWTLYLMNGPTGTDVGMLPSLAARELGCQALRATAHGPTPTTYAATLLEVFDPSSEDLLRGRRLVYAVNDGGRWVFGQWGEPFEFEDLAAYERRRIADRFDAALLGRYLRELGVPAAESFDYGETVLVELAETPEQDNRGRTGRLGCPSIMGACVLAGSRWTLETQGLVASENTALPAVLRGVSANVERWLDPTLPAAVCPRRSADVTSPSFPVGSTGTTPPWAAYGPRENKHQPIRT